jgi:hypothetical protein
MIQKGYGEKRITRYILTGIKYVAEGKESIEDGEEESALQHLTLMF